MKKKSENSVWSIGNNIYMKEYALQNKSENFRLEMLKDIRKLKKFKIRTERDDSNFVEILNSEI